jgi:hypothetical protein
MARPFDDRALDAVLQFDVFICLRLRINVSFPPIFPLPAAFSRSWR